MKELSENICGTSSYLKTDEDVQMVTVASKVENVERDIESLEIRPVLGQIETKGKHLTQFLMKNTPLPPYVVFPKFLLDMQQLNETAKILYVLLLDRARLSQKNKGWTNEDGYVYIFYTIKELAENMHKGETTIKTALRALEQAGLILRKRQGLNLANIIYVKVLPMYHGDMDRGLSMEQTEICPTDRQKSVVEQTENHLTDGQKTSLLTDGKLSISNKEMNNVKKDKEWSKGDYPAYGEYKNVFLTDEALKKLQKEVPLWKEYIEKLSCYMKSTGKTYVDHAATIKSWSMRDNLEPVKRSHYCHSQDQPIPEKLNYGYKEGESL